MDISTSDLETFWHRERIDTSRGYASGFSLQCPNCGRYSKTRSVAAIESRSPRDYPHWYNRCAFRVWCRKDGDSPWLIL